MTMIINDENIQEPADIKEGDTVNISCSAQSNPPKVMFKWYIEDIIEYDKVIDGDTEDQTSLLHITGMYSYRVHFHLYSLNIVSAEIDKSMNGKNVKCWASNKIQNKPYETEEVHTLNVHCKYPIVPGSHVTTSCLLSPAQTPPPSPRSRLTCPRTPARRSRWSARRTATPRPLMRGSGELINWCIRLRSSTLILFLCQILYLS